MRSLAPFALLALSLLGTACGRDRAPAEPLGRAASPIFNGELDSVHSAVVFVELSGGSCSGTLIAACGGTGYVLTAAHCCAEPVLGVVQGEDAYDSGAPYFDAIDAHADPAYDGASDHDYCIVRVGGVPDGTPVIPAMRPDEDTLSAGDMVEFVGYGITESDWNNSQRRHVSDDISDLTPGVMSYDQQPGGPCNGDSGGPALSIVGGSERVSGVTSQGDEACVSYGESGRVSFVYDSFIQPALNGCIPNEPVGGAGGSTGAGGSPGVGGSAGGEAPSGGAGGDHHGEIGGSDGGGVSYGGESEGGDYTEGTSMIGRRRSCAFSTPSGGGAESLGWVVALGVSAWAAQRRTSSPAAAARRRRSRPDR